MTRNSGSATTVHIGAGGQGRETVDELVLLDDPVFATEQHRVPVRRPHEVADDGSYVIEIADPVVRRTTAKRMCGHGLAPISVVHPRATIAHDVQPPDGCLILANAFVSTGVRLAVHTQVHYNATTGQDSTLDELYSEVTVGSKACVLPGLFVGARTIVGAGAVATKNPAR